MRTETMARQVICIVRSCLLSAGLALGLLVPVRAAAGAEPPALEVYGALPAFEDAAISASGRYVAILATVEGKRRLLVNDDKGTPAISYLFGESDKIRGIRWAGDQAVLVSYSMTSQLPIGFSTSKAELGSVLVVPLDRSQPWAIFAKYRNVYGGVQGNFGLAQRAGKWFGYFGGVSLNLNNALTDDGLPDGLLRPDLYEVDLQTQKIRRLAQRPEGSLVDRDWLMDGTGAIGASLDWMQDTGRWVLYGGKHEELASGKTGGGVALISFTPDGSEVVYAVSEVAGETGRWFSVPLSGGTPRPYLDGIDVGSISLDHARRLTGYTVGLASGGAHYFDPARDTTYRKIRAAFRDKRITLQSASDDFDHLLISVDGMDDPGTWYRVDAAEHRANAIALTYPLASEAVGSSRFFPYTAADGTKMEGVLTLPPGRTPKDLPAVIMPHGGPAAHDEPGFDWWAQAYASRGYAVFQPNFRGSTGYGDDFRRSGKGEWGRRMQTDISDGLAALTHQGIVDPRRVAIVGASYGGYAALAGVTLQQSLYRCAVAVAGISDLRGFVSGRIAASGDPVFDKALQAEVGTGRNLEPVSPIRFADKVAVPVMLIHGKDDTVVGIAQSANMAAALRRAGKTVEFITLPGEDHWLSKSVTRLAMLKAAVGFVVSHNPPDPEPAKAAQDPKALR